MSTALTSNTHWHPDPDGDGIPSTTDLCPNVYDVQQEDSDGDSVGNLCDPDFVTLTKGGSVVDLRAEHVTPYGGWFGFTSPDTTRWGQDYVIAWSEKRADLRSAKSIASLPKSNTSGFRVFAYAGHKIAKPQIITAMMPKTMYYVAVSVLGDNDKPSKRISNIVAIKTHEAVSLRLQGAGPRIWATPAQLGALKNRNKNSDRSWKKWAAVMGPSVLDAARSGTEHDFGECLSAALLYHGTGSAKYKNAALSLIQSMVGYWNSHDLRNNQLRWADSNLAICADLMWPALSCTQKNTIVAAYLEDDEKASIERMVDTDEYASITRTWVVDGLVGCGAQGVSEPLSARACALLDRGMRAFYGVQLVKARRNSGFFAQAGGNLPDGIGYGLGSSGYWLQTLHALGNVGGQVDVYAPWVWHNLQAMQIQALTPRRLGLATFGDLDSYDNFGVEPNSHPLLAYGGGLIAMHMGLLERAGESQKASHARWHLDNLFPDDAYGGNWAMLLFAHDGIVPRNDNAGVATSFYDAAMGMFYDRTSWSKDASFFTFRAGWSGVDHAHEDVGSFQLYRKGVWLTHEALGYDGPSAQAEGHNVPALEIGFEGRDNRVGQFRLEPAAPARILRATTERRYAFVAADLLGAYTSGRYHSFLYDAVDRQVFWLKATQTNTDDRLVIYDRIASKPGAKKGVRAWQMHLNAKPDIQGARATFEAGSRVDVQVVLPADVTLQYEPPAGKHSQYPGERYTGRLLAEATSNNDELQYLTVVRASDAATHERAVAVESEHFVGTLSGSDLVLFAKQEARPVGAMHVRVRGNAPLTVWWTGLQANTAYTLGSATDQGALVITAVPGANARSGVAKTNSGGVLVMRIE